MTVTLQQIAAHYGRTKRRGRGWTPNKYGAVKTTINGLRFDSKHEAKHYQSLKWREAAGEIRDLQCQVPFEFMVNGYRVGKFTADFVYTVAVTGEVITEDAKSGPTRTEAYQLRKRLMRACHSVVIAEV